MVCAEKMGKYTLIITEKPDAAKRIATALDEKENPKRLSEKGMPYYIATRNKELVIVPALGHLYTVAEEERSVRTHYPVFHFKWVPRYIAERDAKQTRKWLEAISKLAQGADAFIDACDYDIEGSIIGYNILKYACNGKENVSKRMKYSTLTKEELEKSFAQPLPHLDFALIEAGLTRHEVDWLYGINLSRALTTAAKNQSGRYTTLSTGRVQGPTLKFIATREKTIKTHVPTPYWTIKARIQIDNQTYETQHEKEKITTKHEANTILNECKEKNGQVKKIETKQFQQAPPFPFDLGSLQSEAYSLFGYTPKKTSDIAQHLYLDALISYPRTNSQKLPATINCEAILKSLSKASEYRKLATELLARSELRPNEGKLDDPAHPAIYPTGKLSTRTLDASERSIWDLIIRRFLAVFAEPALIQSIKATININAHRFFLKGKRTLKEGWLHYYKPYARSKEALLPPIKEGRFVTVKEVICDDKFTQPPPRYNHRTLLKRMEKEEIGTKATRGDIIQTLFDRKYIKDRIMIATDLSLEVLNVLEKNCKTIISVKFTRELEEKMNNIQTDREKREQVITDTIKTLKPVIEKLKEKEKIIGEQLAEAIKKSKTEERAIGTCPTCKTGMLTILHSRKTGKRFIGCTNYFKGLCKTSFPLPQKGNIKPLNRTCYKCGWPTIQVRVQRRYAWTLCLNPQCPLKEARRTRIEVQNMPQRSN